MDKGCLKNFDPKSLLKLDIIFIFVKFVIVSSNLNIRGELKIKNNENKKNQKSKKNKKIKNPKIVLFLFYFLFRKIKNPKIFFFSVLICVLSFLLVLFCLEK